MSKTVGVIGVLALLLSVGGCTVFGVVSGSYNNLVTLSENVNEKWGQVENVFQPKPYFAAEEGAEKAPRVDFSSTGGSR